MGGCKQAGGPQAGWHGGTHHGVRDPWQGKPRGLGDPRLLEEREGDPPPPASGTAKAGKGPPCPSLHFTAASTHFPPPPPAASAPGR